MSVRMYARIHTLKYSTRHPKLFLVRSVSGNRFGHARAGPNQTAFVRIEALSELKYKQRYVLLLFI